MLIEVGEAGGVAELPLVGQPDVEVAHGPGGQIHQQLRQVELRIDAVPAAGGSQAGEEVGGAAAARIADEKGILSIEHHAFHLALDTLLSMGTAPSEQKTFGSAHWPSV